MNTSAKKIIKIVGLAVFLILIVGYALFVSRGLVFGVKIKNVNINGTTAESGATMADSILKITGTAKNAINLSLNGREISVDQAGNFGETIALLSGYNIITIIAKDKFGYVDEKDYKLILK
jgi:hypothetical protein